MNILRDLYDAARQLPEFKTVIEDGIETDPVRISVKNHEKGISLLATRRMALVKVRTRGAGYRVVLETKLLAKTDAALALAKAQEAMAWEPQDQTILPPAHKFGANRWEVSKDAIVNINQIGWVKVLKLATIEPDGRITDDIHSPGKVCWYLLDCNGLAGATFNLLTDGEEFYVTDRLTSSMIRTGKTIRVKSGTNVGKATVDLGKTTLTDKEMVNAAIELWINTVMEKN